MWLKNRTSKKLGSSQQPQEADESNRPSFSRNNQEGANRQSLSHHDGESPDGTGHPSSYSGPVDPNFPGPLHRALCSSSSSGVHGALCIPRQAVTLPRPVALPYARVASRVTMSSYTWDFDFVGYEDIVTREGKKSQNKTDLCQPPVSTERPNNEELGRKGVLLGHPVVLHHRNLLNVSPSNRWQKARSFVETTQGGEVWVRDSSSSPVRPLRVYPDQGPSQQRCISGSRSQSPCSSGHYLPPLSGRATPVPPNRTSVDSCSKYHKDCRKIQSPHYMDWFALKENKKKDLSDLQNMGYKEFQRIVDLMENSPVEQELIWKLGSVLRDALQAKAYRVFRVPADPAQSQYLHILHVDNAETSRPILSFKKIKSVEKSHILQAARQGVCLASRKLQIPVLTDPSLTVKADDDVETSELRYVMAVPILNEDFEKETFAYVTEVWRSQLYTETDHIIASNFMLWSSIALHYDNKLKQKRVELKSTDFLLDTVKAIFEKMVSLDIVIKRVLQYAQKLVNADRASLFLVDYRNNELVSTVFDLKLDYEDDVEKKEIRMPMNRGIAGHVANTGESMNIHDAYTDKRFNREVDEATGYKTNSILCMPVKIEGSVIGVVQMVNKREGEVFSPSDETSFEKFAPFFALGLHHARLYDKISRKEQKYKVALEVLSYHNTCRDSEVEQLLQREPHAIDIDLSDFYLDPFQLDVLTKCQSVIIMFNDLFDMSRFDTLAVTKFILTVKKNYRLVPYHNFDHGWSVAQTMYAILKNDESSERFTYKQRLALFVASLCHDLDHRGYTNKYMSETASPLAAIYSTSTLENHHFNTTVTILQQDGHNIFSHLSRDEFKEILGLIRHCILATDLANFFNNLAKMQQLCSEEEYKFSWEEFKHKELAMAMSMTASDLSASAKPWDVQNKTVKVIFEEFYDQGDKEKAAGREPIPMMDRNQPKQQSSSQVQFIKQICLPCYQILQKLLPATTPLHLMAKKNLHKWVSKANQVAVELAEKIASQAEKQLQSLHIIDVPSADSVTPDEEVNTFDSLSNNPNSLTYSLTSDGDEMWFESLGDEAPAVDSSEMHPVSDNVTSETLEGYEPGPVPAVPGS